jgi:hypothetical protein
MGEHGQLIQWALAAIGLGQGLLLALFGMTWNRQREITQELREEIAGIWKSVRTHHEDTHAHGNGMPRGEVEANVKALADQARSIAEQARVRADENREEHGRIYDRLDDIMAAINKRP